VAGTNGGEGTQAGREGRRTFMSTGRRLADAQAMRLCDAIGMDARDNEGLAGAINGESAGEARRGYLSRQKECKGQRRVAELGNTDGSWKNTKKGKIKLKKVHCTTA